MGLLTVCVSCEAYRVRWERMTRCFDDVLGGRPYLIVTGDPTLDVPWRLDGHRAVVRADDGYAGLPMKTLLVARMVTEDPRFADVTAVWKVDDDIDVSRRDLPVGAMLEQARGDFLGGQIKLPWGNDRRAHMGRCAGSSWNDRPYRGRYTVYAWGGNTYVVSRRALEVLAAHFAAHGPRGVAREDVYEDVMVARVLADHGIRVRRAPVLARHVIADALIKPGWMLWLNRHVINCTWSLPRPWTVQRTARQLHAARAE